MSIEFINGSICNICPRNCYNDRNAQNNKSKNLGYCNTNTSINVASICIHKGEEPPISGNYGICNVFFSQCNLQCVYCQNYQISQNSNDVMNITSSSSLAGDLENEKMITDKILEILSQGIPSLGFVSPSHQIPQMIRIIESIRDKGLNPIIVYNTNSYDKIETIKSLESYVNVYLPDFKYFDNELAKRLSDADNYFQIALGSIMEMFRQKGSELKVNENGYAENGLIIRHLVLPGYIGNSKNVLRTIAHEISNEVSISLMSQYNPIHNVSNEEHWNKDEKMFQNRNFGTRENNKYRNFGTRKSLNRKVTFDEYNEVIDEMESLGFENGWIQEFDSPDCYNPDFDKENPFK